MKKKIHEHTVLSLKQNYTVEFFKTGALLLNFQTREVTETDTQQAWILKELDGRRTLDLVVKNYSEFFSLTPRQAKDEVIKICERLLNDLSLLEIKESKKGEAMSTKRYIQNPDVNQREEDEDGALLFNPDTDQVQLISKTGLYIWKLCIEPHTVEEIVNRFREDFDEVPEDQVTTDVEEFLKQMVDSGFIGSVGKV
jgi:hypothetical protein